MPEIQDLFETARRSWIESNDRFAAHTNEEARKQFEAQARSYADNPALKIAKPVAPSMVKAVQEYVPFPKCEFVPTGVPVSTLDPDSLKPVVQADVDGVGGPIGGPVKDEFQKVVPGKFQKSSQDTLYPGAIWETPDKKRKFVKVARTPFDQFWLEL